MNNDRRTLYEGFLDAVDNGNGYLLECEQGHRAVPTTRHCPDCGSRDRTKRALPTTGELETYTRIHVSSSEFESPYLVGIASFDPVSLTGQLRDFDKQEIQKGTAVVVDVEQVETKEERILVFRPQC